MSDRGGGALTAKQQALVLQGLRLVKSIALEELPRLSRRFTLEELISIGQEGLNQAAKAFDAPLLHDEHAFDHFAKHRIRGAMRDANRSERREQARVSALAVKSGVAFLERQRREGDAMTDRDGKAEERLITRGGATAASMFSAAVGAVLAENAEEAFALRRIHARGIAALRRAIAKLNPNDARVIQAHYFEQRPLKAIGEELRLRHPAVYRVHDRALVRLDALLRAEGLTELPPREDEL
jgi:RNA polymerase sigma factor FliA